MFVVVCYGIADERRLRRVARETEDFGSRVKRSVLVCRLADARLAVLKRRPDLRDRVKDATGI